MYDMLARWLKKEDEKSTPNWRSLCRALYSVDMCTADDIAKKHYVTGYKIEKGIENVINLIQIFSLGINV